MRYDNASDILPAELLKEIQKYAAGKLLYIPSGEEKRAWGETSGYREQLQKRNRMIRNKYAHGITVSELADEYFLSLDSIKKIIYSKHNGESLTYAPTLESAVHYTNAGMIEEWIQCYLLLTRKDAPTVQDVIHEDFHYLGIVKFPLRLIQLEESDIGEIAGDESEADISVSPPLLLEYEEGKFYCTGQREFMVSLKKRKINAFPAIIVLKGNTGYKRFMKYYGNKFIYIDKA